MELAAQAEHEDDLPENLSEITDLWNSPARTHVRHGHHQDPVSLLLELLSPRLGPVSLLLRLLSRSLLPFAGHLRQRALGCQARG